MAGIKGEYIYDKEGKIIGATGGKLAGLVNKERHGSDYYSRIGKIGGQRGRGGGFASEVIGKDGLTGSERAREAGRLGGLKSRRRKNSERQLIGSTN